MMRSNKFLCDICNSYYFVCKITDKLYISDYKASICYDILKNLGIKQILSVGVELPDHKTDEFKLKHIKIDDHPDVNITQHFEDAYLFIDQGVTLVHCYAGISRSATIVISYLMKKYNQPLTFAYEYCKKVRPFISPNNGFMNQLLQYEKVLKENNIKNINNKIYKQILEITKYSHSNRAVEQSNERANEQANEQAINQSNEQANERANEQANEQANNQSNEQANEQANDIINICDNIFSASFNGKDIKLSNLGINMLEYLYK
jgi:predicted protein tyrosine phosphatase